MNTDAWRSTKETFTDYCPHCDRETVWDVYWDSSDKQNYSVCRECDTIERGLHYDSSH
jgi:transcription elongation factor Elf1